MNAWKKRISLLLALLMLSALLVGCTGRQAGEALQTASELLELLEEDEASPDSGEQIPVRDEAPAASPAEASIDEDGVYTTKEDLALYIHTYGHLPSNFITKAEAQAAGWSGGSLERCCPGKCIGGDRFGNREGLLPSAKGRTWTECDVNTLGARSRGAERIVFSNDGLIYYTSDHYDSFQQLY